MPKFFNIQKNYNLTCVRQRIGHVEMHLKQWLHCLLFSVHVFLCLFTAIALEMQTVSHLPHRMHWSILFPTLHLELCRLLNSSRMINSPTAVPIEYFPPRYLKLKTSLLLIICWLCIDINILVYLNLYTITVKIIP